MKPVYKTSKGELFHDDCLNVLRDMPDNSVDAVVTDPPYGWSFMGKKWDYDIPSVETWAEVLRVLKPGGHALVACGVRTQHRMAVNIEDAGFEIRDVIAWVYGSGFPKSRDISKDIANRADPDKVREIKLWLAEKFDQCGKSKAQINEECGFVASDYLKTEPGNDAGGRATWHMLLPYGEKWKTLKQVVGFGGDYDNEIEKYGVIAEQHKRPKENKHIYGKYSGVVTEYQLTEQARQWDGWGTALKPAREDWTLARKPLQGTVAENVLEWGTGGLNIDECRVEGGNRPAREVEQKPEANGVVYAGRRNAGSGFDGGSRATGITTQGRFPANLIHDGSEEVVGLFPEQQSGAMTKHYDYTNNGACYGDPAGQTRQLHSANAGSAARFFYCAKASPSERQGNDWPTVKPYALIKYLVQLITPRMGIVLDPFVGSGTTPVVCEENAFQWIGIDKEQAAIDNCLKRLRKPKKRSLFECAG